MSDWALQSMGSDPQLLSKRLSGFVSRLPAKELARTIGCDVRTAENIRGGHWPIARHWLGLVAAFGEDITEAVFHPERCAARLEREVRDLEEQLAKKRADLRVLETSAPRSSEVPARGQDRPAEERLSFQDEDKIVFLRRRP